MSRDPRTYTPKKAGEEIGASADTIRRYCALYGRHLSPGATPEAGKPRILTVIDVYLLRVAKQATEAGSTSEEVDDLLASVAIPEDVVADEEEDQVGETLPVAAGETSESALLLLRQMASTLDRLEARDRRFDQLSEEVAELRRVVDSKPASGEAWAPSSTWSEWIPYALVVGAILFAILILALVVALLR